MIRKDRYYRALAIVNAYDVIPPIRHFIDRMAYELKQRQIELEIKSNAEILTLIGRSGEVLCQELPYDFILYLDKDRYIAKMLERTGIRLFNSADAMDACDDKMETYLRLADEDIRMPRTVSGPLHYSLLDDERFLENVAKVLGFPMVVKANHGSQGNQVYLANDAAELKKTEALVGHKARVYQEYVETSKGVDYRLIVIGGKFVAGYKRVSEGDFRANIAQGGKGFKQRMSAAQIILAEKVARLLDLDYCGVDLLDSGNPDEPILCEVNSNAFLEGVEATTGINVAQAYVDHIFQEIYVD